MTPKSIKTKRIIICHNSKIAITFCGLHGHVTETHKTVDPQTPAETF